MPELPEVETIVRELAASDLAGKTILKAAVHWNKTVGGDAVSFLHAVQGQKIKKVVRYGKWIEFELTDYNLFVHLRMTGKFFFGSPKDKPTSHERVRLILDDGRILKFEDQRKFGRWLLQTKEKAPPNIGIDPFSKKFTLAWFKALVQKSSQAIKPFLLNQKNLAGLGNIYVDEALWQARLHPKRSANTLTPTETTALFKAIPDVLQKGIDNTGTTLGNKQANYYSVSGRRGGNQHKLMVFRRDGLPCPRCTTTIVKTVVAQRGTHFCPTCQLM